MPFQNEAPSELSDPEDDILPPPMGPISNHTQFLDSTPKPQLSSLSTPAPVSDRGFRPGPAGAPSVDSAVESWEGSSAEIQRTKSSVGRCNFLFFAFYACFLFILKNAHIFGNTICFDL